MKKDISKGIEFLKINDLIMSRIIEEVGEIEIKSYMSLFESLVRIIISQQLSNSASNTIISRFTDLIKDFTPVNIIKCSEQQVLLCGISRSKYSFIIGLSQLINNNDLILEELYTQSNEQVKETLIKIKGLGLWSINIFMIFGLQRLNVLPLNDVGIQNSIKKFYNLKEKPSENKMIRLSKKWGEYSSISCLYLWKAYDDKVTI